MEQFLERIPNDLRTWLLDKKVKTIKEAAELADGYAQVRRKVAPPVQSEKKRNITEPSSTSVVRHPQFSAVGQRFRGPATYPTSGNTNRSWRPRRWPDAGGWPQPRGPSEVVDNWQPDAYQNHVPVSSQGWTGPRAWSGAEYNTPQANHINYGGYSADNQKN